MEPMNDRQTIGAAARAGALLLLLWGVLHVWVGVEGVRQYLTNSSRGLWTLFLGGANAPVSAYQHTVRP